MARAAIAGLDVPLGPALTEEQAAAIFARGKEAVIFALLELAQMVARAERTSASVSSPATPSGTVPVHQKPAAKKRGKTPGRKAGHAGSRRKVPHRIDERKTHRAAGCGTAPDMRHAAEPDEILEIAGDELRPVVADDPGLSPGNCSHLRWMTVSTSNSFMLSRSSQCDLGFPQDSGN